MIHTNIRKTLVELLRGGQAHITTNEALDGLKQKYYNVCAGKGQHTIFELIEHMRITQEDILRYMLDPTWESPDWPDGYWPSKKTKVTKKIWESSVNRFQSDLKDIIDLVLDKSINLFEKIPHSKGHIYLREILLVADHNAYHTGQIMLTRKHLEISLL